MTWPSARDYNEAVQNLRVTAREAELREGEVAVNALGIPMPYSGHFADVYKVNCPASGNTWALKCFTREVPGLHDRYREISRCLEAARLPFMVDFRWLDEGLQIGGRWYPALKMRWVEGLGLNYFVGRSLDQPAMLGQLLSLWIKVSTRLREKRIAHADLQHGNVLLVPKNDSGKLLLKLIDYDGMFVPSLEGTPSGELGHPSYQHPRRLRESIYSADVDRFSHLAIYTAIQSSISGGRLLWERYDNRENLLFRESDFVQPGNSKLFRELWSLPHPNTRLLVGHLALATLRPLDQVPLLDELIQEGQVRQLAYAEQREVNALLGVGVVKPRSPVAAPVPSVAASTNAEAAASAEIIDAELVATSAEQIEIVDAEVVEPLTVQARRTAVSLVQLGDELLRRIAGEGNTLVHNFLRVVVALLLIGSCLLPAYWLLSANFQP